MLATHYCDQEQCRFCHDQRCTTCAYHVGRRCVSYRRKARATDYAELMKAPFQANCRKTGTGYKVQHERNLLK